MRWKKSFPRFGSSLFPLPDHPSFSPRIVSLLPSATEIVCFLGFQSHLVGRSHECDFPTTVIKKVPVCTSSLIDSSRSSADINADVHAHLEKGLSLYEVDWTLLEQLKPDLILTQSHCRACALHKDEILAKVHERLGKAVQVIDLCPQTLADIWSDIERVGKFLGIFNAAQEKIHRLLAHVQRIKNLAKGLPDKPRVATIEWIDPLMSAGNWVPELVELAGGVCIFGTAGAHSAWMTWDQLRKENPDVIAVLACGFDVDRARAEMGPLTKQAGWYDLKAVQHNCVFLLDGNQFFNRPGPRMLESLEIFAEIFHPDVFDFGHKLENWQYWGFDRVE